MIKLGVSIVTKQVSKNLKAIREKDIPAAKGSAFVRAGAKVNTEVATYLSNTLGVPKWMVAGVRVPGINGKKSSKGSRIGRTKYIKRLDGMFIFFRYDGLNPGGNIHKQAKLTASRRGVRKHGRSYPNAFVKNYGYFPSIYSRTDAGLKLESIKITRGHVSNVRRLTKHWGVLTFKKRFDHEFSRRLKRRGKF